MKAVGLYKYLPITNEESLVDVEVEQGHPTGYDLLIRVQAVSVNPVDIKVRAPKDKEEEKPKILGFDASGIVEEVGEECSLFKKGDKVYYAGSIDRQGTNSEYHLVDERIVGRKPENLSFAEAAAMPLTTLTAWEGLFQRLHVQEGESILIINGGGGVGSIAIQLAKQAGLTVIATSSRIETSEWCKGLGADFIINHYESMEEQLKEHGMESVDNIFCLHSTDKHWEEMSKVIRPQGKICSIVENEEPIDLKLLQDKSISFFWEFMFTRPLYETDDMVEQHHILNKVGEELEKENLQHTLQETISPINAENMRKAHGKVEKGKMIGKIVVEGWGQ
ncbi:zinc-binding alcohol dehydrogenase family protein [Priestia endophytica]|uniref:Zinc-type alcohol dehydrogenase-like protein n=1 Tax=Priestia endophytica TaxID=135735 RepID=A0AAX1Q411_9BACI|nr:zinc-binding alcohol dehydrogenase family protein [Priestia endophytica]RAS72494.1 NADPH:quinone reductase [Priestia endophytica]RAS90132.1 NADPH:quinone reductase [Priestia endophytica]